MNSPRATPRVLILGGGFAGIGAARKLAKSDAEIVLVDGHDYHTFQPMLYQVATDLLADAEVAHPLRDLFHDQPNVIVHEANATSLDLDGNVVEFDRMGTIGFDYLVLGLGAEVNFFGVEGAAEHAFPMYTLADAVRLKEHVLRRWEAADRDPALVDDGALAIVVVGGGPTGVESVGALAELYRSDFAKDYPSLPIAEAKLTLVEAGPTLFSMFDSELQTYTHETLTDWGVELLLNEVVASVSPTRVTLQSGRELKAHTLVWGAGLHAHPLAASIGIELKPGGRIPVGPELAIELYPKPTPPVTSPGSPIPQPARCCRSSVRSRCRRGRRQARTSRAGSPGMGRSRSATTTRERWPRSAGAPQ